MTEDQAAELFATEHGLLDPDVADRVHQATGGHPELVRLAAQIVADRGPVEDSLVGMLAEPGSSLHRHVQGEMLAGLGDQARELLRDVAELDPVDEELCVALGHTGAADSLAAGDAAGLMSEKRRLVPVVAAIMRRPAPRRQQIASGAAAWYAEKSLWVAAVRAWVAAEAFDEAAALLDSHGEAILAAGHAHLITEVLGRLSALDRRRGLLLGDALRVSGQVMSAAHAYTAVADTVWDNGVAWRVGLVHYLRGDSKSAVETFARGEPGTDADTARLLAWHATARLQLGEEVEATELARAAVRLAGSIRDDSALANAYVSLALCTGMAGDTTETDELLTQALSISVRLGDIVLRARILTTQTYRLLREARYADAQRAAQRTARCASVAGHNNLRMIALCNEADALTMLGRFDAAQRQYERVMALCRRMGSRRSAAAQLGLGEIHRRRGWGEQARGCFEQAVKLAEESGNNQVLVCALAGLARVLVGIDPTAADAAAKRAAAMASAGVVVTALLAQGWVALGAGDSPGAIDLADQAAALARLEGDRAGLAAALELKALTDLDLRKSRSALREAHAIWLAAGATAEAAKIACHIGSLPGATTDDRLAALIGAEDLIAAGATVDSGRWGRVPEVAPRGAVSIRAFGRFEVLIDDEPVSATQWQSRKARDLLRILVARRGRPLHRAELSELLWPDDDPERTGHRLSVLLSIVRGVLDPSRALAGDYYLVADQASVALDVTRVEVDVEEFLADVGHGRRLRDRGATAQAAALLAAADARYRADVFADEPYADWAVGLREEARAALVQALRLLAQISRAQGDSGAAVGYLLRLLGIDPYDEGGHRALIETQLAEKQHGEARRAYGRYREAMAAIGVRPAYQYQEPMHTP